MRIAIVGGKLQGVEACYLARKAGWTVCLVDRRPDVPARGLCDEFRLADVCDPRGGSGALAGVDLVFPALEDTAGLQALVGRAERKGIPLTFDPVAYRISSSKLTSDRLFADLGLPAPRPWPQSSFPVIAKPSSGSGSRGVRVIRSERELAAFFPQPQLMDSWVLQEFLEGPSYSIEVLGTPGSYRAVQVTDLFVDRGYDCMRVEAPSVLPAEQVQEFGQMARLLAEAVQLKGLMDVEVILNQGKLKVLEIDARLPSQTPTAVWWSSGFNMVDALCDVFLRGITPAGALHCQRAVVYEHIHATPSGLEMSGEHIMATASPLRLIEGFFGADEALSDYEPGRPDWRATLISTGKSHEDARAKSCRALAAVRRSLGAKQRPTAPSPDGAEGAS
ncbi:MAG: 3-methylornithine--L-lysine ligase PylC [Hyphomicrobiales bacterium]